MKINKLLIRISHLFGFNKECEHVDDVSIYLNLKMTDDCKLIITDETLKEVYKKLDESPKLKERCSNVSLIYIVDRNSLLMDTLGYIDGVIYTKDMHIEYKRELNLKKLFNI